MQDEFVIDRIEWQRLRLELHIRTRQDEGLRFSLLRVFSKAEMLPEDMEEVAAEQPVYTDGHYVLVLKLSIAGTGSRSFLENGFYAIGAIKDGVRRLVYCEPSLAKGFDALDRIFRYKESYAYTVSFEGWPEEDRGLIFLIQSLFMEANPKWRRRRYLHDRLRLSMRIYTVFSLIARFLLNMLYFAVHSIYKGSGGILLMSERHKTLTGNLKAIDARIRERGIDKDHKISYLFRITREGDGNLIFRTKQMLLLARQDYIFVDDVAPTFTWMRLAKGVCLVQVWHSGGGFKSVGYTRFGKRASPHPAFSFHRYYTYALAGSDSLIETFQEMFGIDRESILPLGIPRIDGFLSEKAQSAGLSRLYDAYPGLKGRQMYFYCPTYRGAGQSVAYFDFSVIDFGRLGEFLKRQNAAMTIRLHPFVKQAVPIPSGLEELFYDLSAYPDINDIFYGADVMITDYSSAYYEYALLRRPMLFYTFDREIYEATRGVYQDVKDSAPGKVCDTFDELMAALESYDYDFEKTQAFLSVHYGHSEQNASDRLLDYILDNGEEAQQT